MKASKKTLNFSDMSKVESVLRTVTDTPMKLFRKKKPNKLGLPPGALIFTGEKKLEKLQVEITEYNEGKYQHRSIPFTELPEVLNTPDNVLWIDITGLHDVGAMEKIATHFGINRLTMEDILDIDQRPKMEIVEDYLYTSVKMILKHAQGKYYEVEQVSFILFRGMLITFQEREGDVFSYVRGRLASATGTIRKRGADYLLYALMDSVVDSYFLILDELGQKIEALEEAAINHPGDDTLNAIYFQRKQLMELRRVIHPLREVSNSFMKYGEPHITEDIHPFVQDLHENTLQVIEMLDSFRDLSSGVLDLCMNVLSNRMNNVMKVLTVISTIFIPLSFVAGVYGMNFNYMPELQWRYGYFFVLGGMGAAVLLMLGYFRWKKWF